MASLADLASSIGNLFKSQHHTFDYRSPEKQAQQGPLVAQQPQQSFQLPQVSLPKFDVMAALQGAYNKIFPEDYSGIGRVVQYETANGIGLTDSGGMVKGVDNFWYMPNIPDLPRNGEYQQPTPSPTATPTPQLPQTPMQGASNTPKQPIQNTGWKSRYAHVWDKVLQSRGIDPSVGHLIARSENGKEIENYANLNYGDMAGTFDVGLTQVNINPPADVKKRIIAETKNMTPAQANVYLNGLIDQGVVPAEAAELRKPEYAINKAVDLYQARLQNLEDPVLAIASYNLGQGGAVLNPQEAMNRARYVYNNAKMPLPDTEFTRDPEGFVRARMAKYKKLGLYK